MRCCLSMGNNSRNGGFIVVGAARSSKETTTPLCICGMIIKLLRQIYWTQAKQTFYSNNVRLNDICVK